MTDKAITEHIARAGRYAGLSDECYSLCAIASALTAIAIILEDKRQGDRIA